ncbi:toxin-antitoxin system HicB family antitoxin [Aureimonas sp. AU12]|uniref:toxin-antitoxin system HicB family antitoxin n=1 Tax=Aureimonas sp. AU12 TaxID=1638161 RepID=UPI0035B5B357
MESSGRGGPTVMQSRNQEPLISVNYARSGCANAYIDVTDVATIHRGLIIRTDLQKRPAAAEKARMVHIRLEPELHRTLRLIAAQQDTTLQEWISRALWTAANAVSTHSPDSERDTDHV